MDSLLYRLEGVIRKYEIERKRKKNHDFRIYLKVDYEKPIWVKKKTNHALVCRIYCLFLSVYSQ